MVMSKKYVLVALAAAEAAAASEVQKQATGCTPTANLRALEGADKAAETCAAWNKHGDWCAEPICELTWADSVPAPHSKFPPEHSHFAKAIECEKTKNEHDEECEWEWNAFDGFQAGKCQQKLRIHDPANKAANMGDDHSCNAVMTKAATCKPKRSTTKHFGEQAEQICNFQAVVCEEVRACEYTAKPELDTGREGAEEDVTSGTENSLDATSGKTSGTDATSGKTDDAEPMTCLYISLIILGCLVALGAVVVLVLCMCGGEEATDSP